MKTFAIVGCGHLGRIVRKAYIDGLLEEYKLIAAFSRKAEDAEAIVSGTEAKAASSMDEIIADYMESYKNYYGVEEGTEQYAMISKIITDFFETMNGRPFPYNALQTVARQYTLNVIGLTAEELASLESVLSQS